MIKTRELTKSLDREPMVISSRTPEGQHNHCPVCGADLSIERTLIQPGMLRVRDAGISSGSLRKTLEISRSSNLSAAGYTQKRWTV